MPPKIDQFPLDRPEIRVSWAKSGLTIDFVLLSGTDERNPQAEEIIEVKAQCEMALG